MCFLPRQDRLTYICIHGDDIWQLSTCEACRRSLEAVLLFSCKTFGNADQEHLLKRKHILLGITSRSLSRKTIVYKYVLANKIIPQQIKWAVVQHSPQYCIYAQQRIIEPCAFALAQANQSLRCSLEDLLNPWPPSECLAKTSSLGTHNENTPI